MNPRTRANVIWIPKDDDDIGPKPFCSLCSRYMVYSDEQRKWFCHGCGKPFVREKKPKNTVVDLDKSEPFISPVKGKKKKDKRDGSIPIEAQIISDIEISSVDGSERELDY